MGMPTQGAQVIPVPHSAQGHGLAFAGTALKSGASILTTTIKVVTFNPNAFLAGGDPNKKPVLIQFRAKSGTLTLGLGDVADSEIHADSVWTDPIPCSGLWAGTEAWYVTGSGTLAMEYRIYTV
jgi:hypothetical protein